MVRGYLAATSLAVAAVLVPPPPGTVVQDVLATHGGYRTVVSRQQTGAPGEVQWYLSVYAPGKAPAMIYRSPSAADPFAIVPKLERGAGTTAYFPHETVKIAGKGELMGEPRDQTLVLVHAFSADCGVSTLSIISVEAGAVRAEAQVSNPCDLQARIDHHRVILSGPYYNASAPLYKPTKNKAVAVLRYADGMWTQTPKYFKLSVPRQSAATPLTSPSPIFTPIFKSVVTTPKPTGAPAPP